MDNVLKSSGLSIGDLAERTGVAPATLRMWETRHGFPAPVRRESGHRRYAESDVEAVREVVRRREEGVRLDRAISQAVDRARAAAAPTPESVFATLRSRHPHLQPQRLTKATLLALSWAIEDEFCARAERATVFGSFQDARFYAPAAPRWEELARVSRAAFALAAGGPDPRAAHVHHVPLAEDSPLRREWTVVCDSVDLPAVLAAWELPGQDDVPDRERLFEAVWAVDPPAVRDAARVLARVAADAGVDEARPVLFELADDPARHAADLATVSMLFNRVVAYVDRFGRS
ncbi:MerR family transcriptional regulator [Nocardioides sp. zg-579]|uniref:MerR family transcriptional regulator n=1 Tax=Nocardioides marmotae TaxID=2663857 RepID=A0A6I3JAV7_9ACTN|nr:DICT sensory domain-containing protein [Nocardioides marmotae]MCR6031608.1 MerR family transcriptional regulator [Gordonia jinghuaiqii]MTB95247.1 MerR family transcriptional regulator [Nocardioides marmotae]QKE02280.1 MerR family transcriptional regulator [Nocardioides marmotae]